jgi:hypothetical protein
MSEPITTTAAVSSVVILSSTIGIVLGPHIGVAELIAAFIGASVAVKKLHKPDDSVASILLMAVATIFFSCYATEFIHALVTTNTNSKFPKEAFPMTVGVLALTAQSIAQRCLELIPRATFSLWPPSFSFEKPNPKKGDE